MKKLALSAVCIGALGLVACSSGGGDDGNTGTADGGGISFTDADPTTGGTDGGGATQVCNPVSNTGCEAGEKCTFIVESTMPFLGRTGCAAEAAAPVAAGGACVRDEASGIDDCAGGTWCDSANLCAEVCSATPDSCGSAGTCVHTDGIFEDDNVGFCDPPCDLFGQDCPNDESCYMLIGRPGAPTVCARATAEPPNMEPGTQGTVCMFINTCTKAYGCVLPPDSNTMGTLTCAYFCDATNMGGPTCAAGPGPAFQCWPISMFYSDAMDVPAAIGMCTDPDIWGPYPPPDMGGM